MRAQHSSEYKRRLHGYDVPRSTSLADVVPLRPEDPSSFAVGREAELDELGRRMSTLEVEKERLERERLRLQRVELHGPPIAAQTKALTVHTDAMKQAYHDRLRDVRRNEVELLEMERQLRQLNNQLLVQRHAEEERRQLELLARNDPAKLAEIAKLDTLLGECDDWSSSENEKWIWIKRLGEAKAEWKAPEKLVWNIAAPPERRDLAQEAAEAQRRIYEERLAAAQGQQAREQAEAEKAAAEAAEAAEAEERARKEAENADKKKRAADARASMLNKRTPLVPQEPKRFCKQSELVCGQMLKPGEKRVSDNGKWRLEVLQTGEVTVREVRTGTVVWTSGALTGATAPFYLVVRSDGDVCLKDADARKEFAWGTSTSGIGVPPHTLQLMDNGTLRLYDSKSLPVWFSSLVGPHEELVHIKPKKPGDVDDDLSQSYGDSDEESVPDSRRSYD